VFDYLTYTLCYIHNGDASTQNYNELGQTVNMWTRARHFRTRRLSKVHLQNPVTTVEENNSTSPLRNKTNCFMSCLRTSVETTTCTAEMCSQIFGDIVMSFDDISWHQIYMLLIQSIFYAYSTPQLSRQMKAYHAIIC